MIKQSLESLTLTVKRIGTDFSHVHILFGLLCKRYLIIKDGDPKF